ncbi:MAG: recombination protein RecR [Candidatus Tectomicrobia bacterium]|nr:recombination protein RecR [Candidatus Tectomicrobia bacterium]
MIRPRSLANLIDELTRLPGIGEKTAQRLAFFLLKWSQKEAMNLAQAIINVKERVRFCSICSSITEEDPCEICADQGRHRDTICVVEEPSDVFAIEKTGEYKGLYHVLMGSLSPLDGIGPEDLKIGELLTRLKEGGVHEVIVATNPNLEGEATAIYLSKLIKPMGVKVTRIAHGLPVGGNLEYADEVTLMKSMEGRREI